MGKEKDIIVKIVQNLKENILMEKDGMEMDIMKMVILYMK